MANYGGYNVDGKLRRLKYGWQIMEAKLWMADFIDDSFYSWQIL